MKKPILFTLLILTLTLSVACESDLQENSTEEKSISNGESNVTKETPELSNEQTSSQLLINNDIVKIDGNFNSEVEELEIELRKNDSSNSESPINIISAAAYANDNFIYVCAEYKGNVSSTFVIELTIKYDDDISLIFFPMSNGTSSSIFGDEGMNDYTSGLVALSDSMIECLLPRTDFQGNLKDDIVSLKIKDDGEVIEEMLIHWS